MALVKNAVTVGSLTMISRVFGYIRDMIIAFTLGAGALNDAFIIAFRLPNLFRTVFGEGAFSAAFVPLFSGAMAADGEKKAKRFALDVQSILLMVLVIFTILMVIFMEKVVWLTAPGYRDNTEIFNIAVYLGRITFPYIAFISLAAFYGGMLNSIGKFFAFAFAPVFLNLVMIAMALFLPGVETKAHALSYGVFVAGAVELAWVMYFAHKNGLLIKLGIPQLTEGVKTLFRRIGPGIVGSSIHQINILVSTIIASFIPSGISYLYYADRVHQLPLALIGTAMGTVLLPSLSRHFRKKEVRQAVDMQNKALEFALFMALPAAFALGFISFEIIGVLFEHGKFSKEATIATSHALIAFSVGLPAFVMMKIFTATFFATGDTKTPVKIAAVSLIINVALSIALLAVFKHVAVAIAASVAGWFNISTLLYILYKRGIYKVRSTTVLKISKYIIASILMVFGLYCASFMLREVHEIIAIVGYVTFGMFVYFFACFAIQGMTVAELKAVMQGRELN